MSIRGGLFRVKLPAGYLSRARRSGHLPMSADYAVWLINIRGLRPAVVPADFTTEHLRVIPPDEQKRWSRVALRRLNKQKRAA